MQSEPRVIETGRGPIEVAEGGAGAAVIVSHGTLGGWDQSSILTQTLTEPGFRYLAVSRPGYLGTPLTSGRSPEEQADLFAALLDALGIPRAAIIGVSGGGPPALQLALRHPERIWGLVLVSTCARREETPKPPRGYAFLAKLMKWTWLREKMRSSMKKNLAASATIFLSDREVFEHTAADPDVGPLLEQFFLGTVDQMAERVAGTYNDIAVMGSAEHELEKIDVETLVVHGTADQMLPYDHAKIFAARIPRARLLTLEGGEHAAMFTHRDEIRAAIMAYLHEHAPAEPTPA